MDLCIYKTSISEIKSSDLFKSRLNTEERGKCVLTQKYHKSFVVNVAFSKIIWYINR